MKHKVIINVSDSNHKEIQVLKASRITIPRKIVQWLFGEYTQVYLLKPGQTIHSVDVKEIKKGVNLYESNKTIA
jgi:hypothetical protein